MLLPLGSFEPAQDLLLCVPAMRIVAMPEQTPPIQPRPDPFPQSSPGLSPWPMPVSRTRHDSSPGNSNSSESMTRQALSHHEPNVNGC